MPVTKNRKTRLLMVINNVEFFLSHRLPVALAAQRAGFDVHIATGDLHKNDRLANHGLEHHLVPISRSGKAFIPELITFYKLFTLFVRTKPSIVHLVTIKPILYGCLAARLVGIKGVVAAISGLGFVFSNDKVFTKLVRYLVKKFYWLGLRHKNLYIIVQNSHDKNILQKLTGLGGEKFFLLPGSGVDLREYLNQPEPQGNPTVVMISRMLVSKGVLEFVKASTLLSGHSSNPSFVLVGAPDLQNPESVTEEQLHDWNKSGCIRWLGHQTEIAKILSASHIVVLPSFYGEGLPKVLIEAAACGRAVITTNMPGCRDAIEPNVTGLLVPPKDAGELKKAIQSLLENTEKRKSMGLAARSRAEELFQIKKITSAHIKIYQKLLNL